MSDSKIILIIFSSITFIFSLIQMICFSTLRKDLELSNHNYSRLLSIYQSTVGTLSLSLITLCFSIFYNF